MGLLSGTRSGDDILLLSNDREIARDDFWAIRLLLATFVAINLILETATYTGPDGLGTFISLLLLLTPVYWVALRLASNKSEQAVQSADVA